MYKRKVLLQLTHHCFGVVHPGRGALEVLPDSAVVGKRQVVALQQEQQVRKLPRLELLRAGRVAETEGEGGKAHPLASV